MRVNSKCGQLEPVDNHSVVPGTVLRMHVSQSHGNRALWETMELLRTFTHDAVPCCALAVGAAGWCGDPPVRQVSPFRLTTGVPKPPSLTTRLTADTPGPTTRR